MRSSLLLTLTAIAALAVSQPTEAQSVRGTVSGATGGNVPGVLVELLDARSLVVARNVTGELGEFRLAAPGAGGANSAQVQHRWLGVRRARDLEALA